MLIPHGNTCKGLFTNPLVFKDFVRLLSTCFASITHMAEPPEPCLSGFQKLLDITLLNAKKTGEGMKKKCLQSEVWGPLTQNDRALNRL
jgi:hypothetical protein